MLHADGHETVALYGDKEMGFVAFFPLQGAHHGLQVGSRLAGRADVSKQIQLVDSLLQVGAADGFQQISDAVHSEGLQGIFVVGGGENDGEGDELFHFLRGQRGRDGDNLHLIVGDVGYGIVLFGGETAESGGEVSEIGRWICLVSQPSGRPARGGPHLMYGMADVHKKRGLRPHFPFSIFHFPFSITAGFRLRPRRRPALRVAACRCRLHPACRCRWCRLSSCPRRGARVPACTAR